MARESPDLTDIEQFARLLRSEAAKMGIPITIVDVERTADEQAKKFAQGRTTKGRIVTNAPPGTSKHEFGKAFDIAFVGTDGKPFWPKAEDPRWRKVASVAERLGLVWGGSFDTFKGDVGHFELPTRDVPSMGAMLGESSSVTPPGRLAPNVSGRGGSVTSQTHPPGGLRAPQDILSAQSAAPDNQLSAEPDPRDAYIRRGDDPRDAFIRPAGDPRDAFIRSAGQQPARPPAPTSTDVSIAGRRFTIPGWLMEPGIPAVAARELTHTMLGGATGPIGPGPIEQRMLRGAQEGLLLNAPAYLGQKFAPKATQRMLGPDRPAGTSVETLAQAAPALYGGVKAFQTGIEWMKGASRIMSGLSGVTETGKLTANAARFSRLAGDAAGGKISPRIAHALQFGLVGSVLGALHFDERSIPERLQGMPINAALSGLLGATITPSAKQMLNGITKYGPIRQGLTFGANSVVAAGLFGTSASPFKITGDPYVDSFLYDTGVGITLAGGPLRPGQRIPLAVSLRGEAHFVPVEILTAGWQNGRRRFDVKLPDGTVREYMPGRSIILDNASTAPARAANKDLPVQPGDFLVFEPAAAKGEKSLKGNRQLIGQFAGFTSDPNVIAVDVVTQGGGVSLRVFVNKKKGTLRKLDDEAKLQLSQRQEDIDRRLLIQRFVQAARGGRQPAPPAAVAGRELTTGREPEVLEPSLSERLDLVRNPPTKFTEKQLRSLKLEDISDLLDFYVNEEIMAREDVAAVVRQLRNEYKRRGMTTAEFNRFAADYNQRSIEEGYKALQEAVRDPQTLARLGAGLAGAAPEMEAAKTAVQDARLVGRQPSTREGPTIDVPSTRVEGRLIPTQKGEAADPFGGREPIDRSEKAVEHWRARSREAHEHIKAGDLTAIDLLSPAEQVNLMSERFYTAWKDGHDVTKMRKLFTDIDRYIMDSGLIDLTPGFAPERAPINRLIKGSSLGDPAPRDVKPMGSFKPAGSKQEVQIYADSLVSRDRAVDVLERMWPRLPEGAKRQVSTVYALDDSRSEYFGLNIRESRTIVLNTNEYAMSHGVKGKIDTLEAALADILLHEAEHAYHNDPEAKVKSFQALGWQEWHAFAAQNEGRYRLLAPNPETGLPTGVEVETPGSVDQLGNLTKGQRQVYVMARDGSAKVEELWVRPVDDKDTVATRSDGSAVSIRTRYERHNPTEDLAYSVGDVLADPDKVYATNPDRYNRIAALLYDRDRGVPILPGVTADSNGQYLLFSPGIRSDQIPKPAEPAPAAPQKKSIATMSGQELLEAIFGKGAKARRVPVEGRAAVEGAKITRDDKLEKRMAAIREIIESAEGTPASRADLAGRIMTEGIDLVRNALRAPSKGLPNGLDPDALSEPGSSVSIESDILTEAMLHGLKAGKYEAFTGRVRARVIDAFRRAGTPGNEFMRASGQPGVTESGAQAELPPAAAPQDAPKTGPGRQRESKIQQDFSALVGTGEENRSKVVAMLARLPEGMREAVAAHVGVDAKGGVTQDISLKEAANSINMSVPQFVASYVRAMKATEAGRKPRSAAKPDGPPKRGVDPLQLIRNRIKELEASPDQSEATQRKLRNYQTQLAALLKLAQAAGEKSGQQASAVASAPAPTPPDSLTAPPPPSHSEALQNLPVEKLLRQWRDAKRLVLRLTGSTEEKNASESLAYLEAEMRRRNIKLEQGNYPGPPKPDGGKPAPPQEPSPPPIAGPQEPVPAVGADVPASPGAPADRPGSAPSITRTPPAGSVPPAEPPRKIPPRPLFSVEPAPEWNQQRLIEQASTGDWSPRRYIIRDLRSGQVIGNFGSTKPFDRAEPNPRFLIAPLGFVDQLGNLLTKGKKMMARGEYRWTVTDLVTGETANYSETGLRQVITEKYLPWVNYNPESGDAIPNAAVIADRLENTPRDQRPPQTMIGNADLKDVEFNRLDGPQQVGHIHRRTLEVAGSAEDAWGAYKKYFPLVAEYPNRVNDLEAIAALIQAKWGAPPPASRLPNEILAAIDKVNKLYRERVGQELSDWRSYYSSELSGTGAAYRPAKHERAFTTVLQEIFFPKDPITDKPFQEGRISLIPSVTPVVRQAIILGHPILADAYFKARGSDSFFNHLSHSWGDRLAKIFQGLPLAEKIAIIRIAEGRYVADERVSVSRRAMLRQDDVVLRDTRRLINQLHTVLTGNAPTEEMLLPRRTAEMDRRASAYRGLVDEIANVLGLKPGERVENYFPHFFRGSRDIGFEIPSDMAVGRDVYFRHLLPRTSDRQDYEVDPVEVMDLYIRGAARKIAYQPLLEEFSNPKVLKQLGTDQRTYLLKWLRFMVGEPEPTDYRLRRALLDLGLQAGPGIGKWLRRTALSQDRPFSSIARTIRGWQFMAKIDYNVMTAAVNLNQAFTTGVMRYGLVGYLKALKSSVSDPEIKRFFNSTYIAGDIYRADIGVDALRLKGWFNRIQQVGRSAFIAAESRNKATAFAAGYRFAKENGLLGADRVLAGILESDLTQFNMTRSGRLPLVRGDLASMIFQFLPYRLEMARMVGDAHFGFGKGLLKMGSAHARDREEGRQLALMNFKRLVWINAALFLVGGMDATEFGPFVRMFYGDDASDPEFPGALEELDKMSFDYILGSAVDGEPFEWGHNINPIHLLNDRLLGPAISGALGGLAAMRGAPGAPSLGSLGISQVPGGVQLERTYGEEIEDVLDDLGIDTNLRGGETPSERITGPRPSKGSKIRG